MKVTQAVMSLCIITFAKSFIDLKSTENITLKYLGMLNIAYTHAGVVLVIFHEYMPQNKQFNRYSLYA